MCYSDTPFVLSETAVSEYVFSFCAKRFTVNNPSKLTFINNLFPPKVLPITSKVLHMEVLTFKPVDETLGCDHSNESY